MHVHAPGRVITRTYRPPENYYIPGGLDTFDRGRMRLNSFLKDLNESQGH